MSNYFRAIQPNVTTASSPQEAPGNAAFPDYRERVTAMYQKYQPDKVWTIDAVLAKLRIIVESSRGSA